MIELVHCDDALLAAALDDVWALSQRLSARVAEGLIDDEFRQAFQFSLDELRKKPELRGWWTVLFVLREPEGATVCGAGGFRGPPRDGMVELGYSIAPSLRGRGLASEAARQLVEYALADARVSKVQAHTLSVANASTRILEKLGFVRVEEYVNPAEHTDPVWRWELRRGGGNAVDPREIAS